MDCSATHPCAKPDPALDSVKVDTKPSSALSGRGISAMRQTQAALIHQRMDNESPTLERRHG